MAIDPKKVAQIVNRIRARRAAGQSDSAAMSDLLDMVVTVKGDQGNEGPAGAKGDMGPRGPQGSKGNDGARGSVGLQGPKGNNGVEGERGPRGDRGPQGDPGDPGMDGRLITAREIVDILTKGGVQIPASLIKDLPTIIERRQLPQITLLGRTGGGRIIFRTQGGVEMQDVQTVDFGAGLVVAKSAPGYLLVTAPGGTGGGANINTEKVTAVQSGSNVTIDLTQLAHVFVAVQLTFKNGGAVVPGNAAGTDGSSAYSITGNSLTIYNADASGDSFLISYTY